MMNKQPNFSPGTKIYLVTRSGDILSHFTVMDTLFGLVSLDKNPLPDSSHQGFTIKGDHLIPNWCAGKKAFLAGYTSLNEDEKVALEQKARIKKRESRKKDES